MSHLLLLLRQWVGVVLIALFLAGCGSVGVGVGVGGGSVYSSVSTMETASQIA